MLLFQLKADFLFLGEIDEDIRSHVMTNVENSKCVKYFLEMPWTEVLSVFSVYSCYSSAAVSLPVSPHTNEAQGTSDFIMFLLFMTLQKHRQTLNIAFLNIR